MLYDVIIVGGGVSGLSAAYTLIKKKQRVLVVERGKYIHERQRDMSFDVSNGIGGAGLFSDGKLSMYPSASKLWKLRLRDLKPAYDQVQNLLKTVNVEIEDFTEEWTKDSEQENVHKIYDSKMMSIEQRMKLIFMLYQNIGCENILVDSSVFQVEKNNGLYQIEIRCGGKKEIHQSKVLLLAGGKHCYQKIMQKSRSIAFNKNKYALEVGFRIECSNDEFDYYDYPQLDVKVIEEKDNHSIRTFCCCRDGIILESTSYDIRSLNGSSNDFEKTGKTNIGVLVKAEGKEGEKLKKALGDLFFKQETQMMNLKSYLYEGVSLLGDRVDSMVRGFLEEHFPKMTKGKGVLFYPSIEKDGYYPELNDILQIPMEDIWVVGDATGQFRGLLSSLISGIFSANCIATKLLAYDKELRDKFHIKVSETKERKVIFTAQSKQFFYCRDVVCEYVLRQGCIPVNPFRLFDYFLSDRVDRDIIRNGNNEMIKRCDELWVFGNVSDGVLFEIYMCRKMGKTVRFFNIATRAQEIKELKAEEVTFDPEIHSFQIKKEDLLAMVDNTGGIPPVIQMELNWDE